MDRIIKVDRDDRCPACGSPSIDYRSTDYGEGQVYMLYSCECGARFSFVYGEREAIVEDSAISF